MVALAMKDVLKRATVAQTSSWRVDHLEDHAWDSAVAKVHLVAFAMIYVLKRATVA